MTNKKFIFRGSVPSLRVLESIPIEPEEGEVVITQDTNSIYIFNNSEWISLNDNNIVDQNKQSNHNDEINLYDLNKSIIGQFDSIKDFAESINLINNFQTKTPASFYLLYGKDLSYFTIFSTIIDIPNRKTLGENVIECLLNISSDIKDISEDQDSIEIWLKTSDNNIHCLYLFKCDQIIVPIGD